jgi:MoCo/4Fe-4S cofactor protein with predicted Tat translocation signal
MKTIPPPCPEPETGPKYWRSLDELAETPEFRQFVEREFPSGASELTDPIARREFVKLMSASFLLAGFGLTGCRKPEEHIVPFSKMPEGYVHGVAKYYATAMPTRVGAIPVLVKSNDGRPTKIEGNPNHPDSNGGTDTFTQASILNLYDPDRATRFKRAGSPATREEANDFLAQLSQKFSANGGTGLAFLADRNTSPSRSRLQNLIAQKFPNARWATYEPIDFDIYRRACSQAFGQSLKPQYRLQTAKAIVALDCDFIGEEEDSHRYCRGFAQGRRMKTAADAMNRLYVIESLLSLTGSNADHRLRVSSADVAKVGAQLAVEVLNQSGAAGQVGNAFVSALNRIGQGAPVQKEWIAACAKDLVQNRGQALVMAGYRQPLAVQLMALAMNIALGAVGKTLVLHEVPATKEVAIGDLARELNGGTVDTLVILGGNPVYNAPADLNWAATQRKAKTVVRYGYYEDETSAVSDWVIPAAHYLESWGDARSSEGTVVPVQPLIEPLFGGVTDLEILARISGLERTSPYEIVRETFAGLVGGGNADAAWRRFLHDGFLANSQAKEVSVTFNGAAAAQTLGAFNPGATPAKGSLEVVFHRDLKVDDGRYSNNGWLQELPEPITKMTWENVIMLSLKTAQDHNLITSPPQQKIESPLDKENNRITAPVVKISAGGREIEGPIWVVPGMADHVVGLALGYGRSRAGRIGTNVGFNAYALRGSAGEFIGGANLADTGRKHPLATTQNHWAMEGRPIVREANLDQYKAHPDWVRNLDMEEPLHGASMYENPLHKPEKDGKSPAQKALHAWGMSIDLTACVGCSACVIACQSENNVPIVGKEMIRRNREMHWLRIDRYFSGSVADPQVVNQPMLCQHCEKAPCENVCPVNATVHDEEGLNLMVYNRCVGTRYCSNNCPYKVRRFNYFDYNKRPLDKLFHGPLAKRPEDEWELAKLARNPDVTVRMRGVMEKCTFCIQRIESAKIAQKVKARASGDVKVPDGTFTTACAQACPAEAIVFGDLSDPNSRVSQLKKLDRDYTVLEFLATKPRLTYLGRIRNPNPEIPDAYKAMPGTFKEYSDKHGNPFEAHGKARGHGDAHGGTPGTPQTKPAKGGAH